MNRSTQNQTSPRELDEGRDGVVFVAHYAEPLRSVILPLCKELKSDPQTENIKIIMLTGKDEQHDRILGLALGADDYIPKPFALDYLRRRIDRLLEKD